MKQKDIFYIVVSSFIVITIWIIANLWHIQNTSKLSEAVVRQTTPITPTFDTETLATLKERSKATPLYTIKNSASQSAIITPTPISIPTVSPTLIPSLTPTVTSEPTIAL